MTESWWVCDASTFAQRLAEQQTRIRHLDQSRYTAVGMAQPRQTRAQKLRAARDEEEA